MSRPLDKFKVNEGDTLYRATKKLVMPTLNYDPDTSKTGCYFAINSPYIALGMAIEYKSNMFIEKFKIKKGKSFIAYFGKYAFRYLDKNYYFDKDGKMIPNMQTKREHNINHFDSELFPIIEGFEVELNGNSGELFVSNQQDMDKIEMTGIYFVKYEDVPNIFRQNLNTKQEVKQNTPEYKDFLKKIIVDADNVRI
jgi:hypothetical protein